MSPIGLSCRRSGRRGTALHVHPRAARPGRVSEPRRTAPGGVSSSYGAPCPVGDLDDPAAAVRRWTRSLRAHGRLLLIEGTWSNGVGLAAARAVRLVTEQGLVARLGPLDDPALRGGRTADERYLAVARAR
jgi:hypothetical protein